MSAVLGGDPVHRATSILLGVTAIPVSTGSPETSKVTFGGGCCAKDGLRLGPSMSPNANSTAAPTVNAFHFGRALPPLMLRPPFLLAEKKIGLKVPLTPRRNLKRDPGACG